MTFDQASVCAQWEYREWKYRKMSEVDGGWLIEPQEFSQEVRSNGVEAIITYRHGWSYCYECEHSRTHVLIQAQMELLLQTKALTHTYTHTGTDRVIATNESTHAHMHA